MMRYPEQVGDRASEEELPMHNLPPPWLISLKTSEVSRRQTECSVNFRLVSELSNGCPREEEEEEVEEALTITKGVPPCLTIPEVRYKFHFNKKESKDEAWGRFSSHASNCLGIIFMHHFMFKNWVASFGHQVIWCIISFTVASFQMMLKWTLMLLLIWASFALYRVRQKQFLQVAWPHFEHESTSANL